VLKPSVCGELAASLGFRGSFFELVAMVGVFRECMGGIIAVVDRRFSGQSDNVW